MAAPGWIGLAHSALGKCSTQDIGEYFHQAGFPPEYADDEVAWCAAFVGSCLKRVGISPSYSLLARSYLRWGQTVPIRKHAVVVISRPGASWMGHVGFVHRYDGANVEILGGNQSRCVNVRMYPRSKILGTRWPEKMEIQNDV